MKKNILITLVSITFCLTTGAQKVVYEIDGQTVDNFDGSQLAGKTIKDYIIKQQPSAQTTIHRITTTDYMEHEKEIHKWDNFWIKELLPSILYLFG